MRKVQPQKIIGLAQWITDDNACSAQVAGEKMQISEKYRASVKALNLSRTMFVLGTVLICTACTGDGESTDQQNDPGQTDQLPPTGSLSPLSEDEWENTLERVLEIVGTDTRNILFDAAVALRYPTSSTDVVEGILPTDELVTFILTDGTPGEQETANCVAGGEFKITIISSDVKRAWIDADECVLDSRLISGQVERVGSTIDVESLKFHDFSVDVGNWQVQVTDALYEFMDGYPFATTSWKGMSYSVQENAQITTVRDFALESDAIWGTAFDKILSMGFTVSGPWTNGESLAVSTPVPFGGLTTSESGRDYTRGTLVLELDEVNRLTLDVDSGEADLVLITLEHEGVVTTHFWRWPDVLRWETYSTRASTDCCAGLEPIILP